MKNRKITERLKKLYALACHGVKGEKVNAEKLLNQLLKKYGLDINDIISQTSRRKYKVTYKNKYESELLQRVYYSIRTNIDSCSIIAKRRTFLPELSKSEYCEFIVKYNLYKKRLAEELELTMSAFINSQNLWYDGDIEYIDKNASKKSLNRADKLSKRSAEIEKIQINKQLTA